MLNATRHVANISCLLPHAAHYSIDRHLKRRPLTLLILFCVESLAADTSGPWLLPPPSIYRDPYKTYLDDSSFHEVEDAKHGEAFSILMDHEAVALSADQQAEFSHGSLRCPSATRPYLVRAIYGFRGTGSYRISQNKTALIVFHGSLGHTTPEPKKSALVVCLSSQPLEVYGSISVAE